MELLFSKFTAVAQRHDLPKHFAQLGCVGVAAVGALGALTASLVGLLASSVVTARSGDALKDSLDGGELNYRTGKLDDGTDPAGWYGDN